MEIAKTILSQLGGNKFIAMTGAKNFGAGKNSLSFKIGRNLSKANYVKIELNVMDTYDVKFIRIHGPNFNIVKELNNVYFDQLQPIFTEVTGLDTYID